VKVVIHQALCGELNKSWELLSTTLPDLALAKRIAFQADLQDSPPSGIVWLPAIRGFSFDKYFLVVKTYPDNSPEVRKGRVFSHVLIINKSDLFKINDLRLLFQHFEQSVNKSLPLTPIFLTSVNDDKIQLSPILQSRFNTVIKSFVNFIHANLPMVWIGQTDFEQAVAKLWQMLNSEQRENFNFGINFNPSEVAKDKLTFIVTPDNLENRFINKGFLLISKQDVTELVDFSDHFIAGHEESVDRITKFMTAIGASSPPLTEVAAISKGLATYESIETEKDLKRLNTLASIIAKYSPKPDKGATVKNKVLKRIVQLLESANEDDLFLLRNFRIESFKDSLKKLTSTCAVWCDQYIFSKEQNERHDYTPFALKVLKLDDNLWLHQVIKGGLSSLLSGNLDLEEAGLFWIWLKNDIAILDELKQYVSSSSKSESNLIETLPEIDERLIPHIEAFALDRQWFAFYAKLLLLHMDYSNALNAWLNANTNENNVEGLDIIFNEADKNKFVELSIENGDIRLLNLAGHSCHANPSLLAKIDVQKPNWLEIWLISIRQGNSLADGLSDSAKTINEVLDLVVEGKGPNSDLLQHIGNSEFGNVLNYRQRALLWSRIPNRPKISFLEKTADAFLNLLSKNSSQSIPTDTELANYIFSTGIPKYLISKKNNINLAWSVFYAYPNLPESLLRDYILSYQGELDRVNATQLGDFVLQKRYISTAQLIYDLCDNHKKYRKALTQCYSLLGFFARTKASLFGWIDTVAISTDEWWKNFIELAYTLYPGGPNDNKIWLQAGGKEYDLLNGKTGKEVWIAALQKLRNKECSGEISIKKLLKHMLQEHRKNINLSTLKDILNKL
jgi:hypothetical protein